MRYEKTSIQSFNPDTGSLTTVCIAFAEALLVAVTTTQLCKGTISIFGDTLLAPSIEYVYILIPIHY